ncbi:MAG TPA: AraC family transcriptional regulator ligand-binding domain-containing protein [Polyangiaceae bacterium]|nr:AraC family transcriptional regulator ligand-binding domain-containing protein [Polyangiaceae bacterium]
MATVSLPRPVPTPERGPTLAPAPPMTVPGSYALHLMQLVDRWSIPAEELLAGHGLTATELEDPSLRIPLQTMNALVARARTLTDEPGLGFYMGLSKRISVYGYLGFAMMNAATLRETLELAARFTPTLTSALKLHFHVEGRGASLVVEEFSDLGDVKDVVTISLLVGMAHIGSTLTGRELHGVAELAIPEPPYYRRFAHIAPGFRFGQRVTRVLFENEHLDLPVVMADRAALNLARQACERELEALGFDGQIGERVRRALPKGDGFRTLPEVASELHVSPRTLTRRLVAKGLSFSDLIDQERRDRAMAMLRHSDASLDDIAEKLGYSTASNFVRAFQRWTGETPAAHRRARR